MILNRLRTFVILSLFLTVAAFESSYAIPIDRFDVLQDVELAGTPGGATTSESVSSAEIIGGARTIVLEAESTFGSKIDVEVLASNKLSHSQQASVSGSSTLIWDGDTLPDINPTGLGGLDFTSDNADSFVLDIFSSDGPGDTVIVEVTVYENNPSGDVFSRVSISIADVKTALGIIPFSSFSTNGPGGAASFQNVGALTLKFDGSNSPDSDLIINSFTSNGVCEVEFPTQSDFLDECGVCNGDDSTCADCAGVPNGDSVIDECGVCGGSGPGECGCDLSILQDQCGVCGGDDSTCADCAGVPNGSSVLDQCGICNGDNSSCADCLGQPNGVAKFDECGVCNGDNSTCLDCAGMPNGSAVLDECGVCNGSGPGECGCDLAVIKDSCGVCGGDDSSCTDCAGVPNGSSVLDQCGVCNGDNSSCVDCSGVPNGSNVPGTSCTVDANDPCSLGTLSQSCQCVQLTSQSELPAGCGATVEVCEVTASSDPYSAFDDFGITESNLIRKVVKQQLRKRVKTPGSGNREIRKSRELKSEAENLTASLPATVSQYSGACICSSQDVSASLDEIQQIALQYRKLMNGIVRKLRRSVSGGECEGTVKACKKRARARQRLFLNFKQQMKDLVRNRQSVASSTVSLVDSCS